MQPPSLGHPERVALGMTEKYCCVYLPDGTASLVATRAGVSIRDTLAVPCKKRGIPFGDVTAYLQSNDKVGGGWPPPRDIRGSSPTSEPRLMFVDRLPSHLEASVPTPAGRGTACSLQLSPC